MGHKTKCRRHRLHRRLCRRCPLFSFVVIVNVAVVVVDIVPVAAVLTASARRPPFCNAADVVSGESFHTFYMSSRVVRAVAIDGKPSVDRSMLSRLPPPMPCGCLYTKRFECFYAIVNLIACDSEFTPVPYIVSAAPLQGPKKKEKRN